MHNKNSMWHNLRTSPSLNHPLIFAKFKPWNESSWILKNIFYHAQIFLKNFPIIQLKLLKNSQHKAKKHHKSANKTQKRSHFFLKSHTKANKNLFNYLLSRALSQNRWYSSWVILLFPFHFRNFRMHKTKIGEIEKIDRIGLNLIYLACVC